MAQQVIDGILYSPVNAHALRKGDLIHLGVPCDPIRVTRRPFWRGADVFVTGIPPETPHTGEHDFGFGRNEPVLRAVGAGVGGLL